VAFLLGISLEVMPMNMIGSALGAIGAVLFSFFTGVAASLVTPG
jgi:hypothetical protein